MALLKVSEVPTVTNANLFCEVLLS